MKPQMYKIYVYNTPLPYITWGLIWDLKTKRRDSDIYNLRQLLSKQKGKRIITIGKTKIQKKTYISNNDYVKKHIKNRKIMGDEEGPQASVPQGAQDPPALQVLPPPQDPPPPLNPNVPMIPNACQAPHPPTLHMPPLNWSHFKPDYSSKPDKDEEAHLLRTNEWMDTHVFQDHIKIQRFCLTFNSGS